ncbi:uncharacterized protein LOC113505862 [Trichoplusia ni]|uniref:Uncharacterized protein LOC113505862 n=1 Tax=Trichoplusia ni TaxID=7111 RepID=A0A7E5WUK8_TRINI|nr:uncharacterized protein LOC113505862 [Trichoplusia ni]
MVQKATRTRQEPQFKNFDETCSCTKCDSLYCFSKRHFEDSCSCSCNNCKESKTCLFYTNRLVRVSQSRSDATNTAPICTISSATGDNAYSNSKYSPFYKVASTNSHETVIASKHSSSILAITNKHSSKTLAITNKQSSKVLAITNKTSKTLAITNKQSLKALAITNEQSSNMLAIINKKPSQNLAITHKTPAVFTNKFLGQHVIVAYETEIHSIFSTQKKPFERSENSIKKEDSAYKCSSCCTEPIPKPESRSCGHHRSAETYKAPEQMGCLSRESYQPSSPGYVLDLSNYKTQSKTGSKTESKTNTCKDTCTDINQTMTNKTTYAKNNDICDASATGCKSGHDHMNSRGYVVDISGGLYRQTRNPLETCKTIFTSPINAIKALCTTCRPQKNQKTLSEGKKYNEGLSSMCKCQTPDSGPGYIIDLNNKKPCDCNQSQEKEQKPFYNKEDYNKTAKPDSQHTSRGYVFNMPKPYDITQLKKCCKCNQPKLESNPPGYTIDLKTNCDCNTPKLVSDPPGYVYNYTQRIKLQRKTTCNCELLPANNLSYPPGFVLVIPPGQGLKDKPTHQTTKFLPGTDSDSCGCKATKNILSFWPGKAKKHTSKNQKNPCSCSGSQHEKPRDSRGYVLELGQYIGDSENKPYNTACKISKPISTSPESSAYKLELCRNILKIQKNAIETLDNLCLLQKKCCNCLPNQIERSENNAKQKYLNKPASIKQQLCQNILETQLNAVGILQDVTCAAQENSYSYPFNEQDGKRSKGYKELLTNKTSCNQCTHPNKNRQKFFINFVETNRTGFDPLGSMYKKSSCECGNKNSPGFVVELVRQKDDPTNKTSINNSQKKKCDCEESRKRLSSSAGYILDLDQYKNEAVNKPRKLSKNLIESECQHKNCECRKRMSSSAGYILDLDQYKHEPINKTRKLSKNAFDVQRNTIESLNNTNQKKKCECSEHQKSSSEFDGYIMDLKQYINLPKNSSQRSNIEHRTEITCNKCCVCKKHSKHTSESAGYVLELSQYKEKAMESSNKKSSCLCSDNKKMSETAGYIFDLGHFKQELPTKTHKLSKNIFGIQRDTIGSVTSANQKKSCGCSETRNKLSSSAGYVLELEQYKKTCACRKSSQMTSEPPGGYIVDLYQYKQKQPQNGNKTCNCNHDKKKTDSASEFQHIGRQLPNIPKTDSRNASEIKTNTNCHKSCVCKKPSKLISDPPGYILDLDQYKQERGKNDHDSCNCGKDKKKPHGSATYLQDISRQPSNIPKQSSKTTSEIKTNTNCHTSCVCQKPSKLISDPPGYILDLDQYKQDRGKNERGGCNCGQGKRKPFGSATQLQDTSRQQLNMPKSSSKTTPEIKTNTNCHTSCVCQKPSKLISDPPGYILDLDQYKQERGKNDQDSCNCGKEKKKPLGSATYLQDISRQPSNVPKQSSKTTSEIKTNTNCHKSCVCQKPSKLISDPPGYILDLDQYKQDRGKNDHDSCNCGKEKKKPLGSATYLQDISRQPSNVPKQSSKTTSEIKTNTNCHTSCVCQKPSKLISDPPGYILDLDQYKQERGKHDHDSCNCGQGKKKPFGSSTQFQDTSRQQLNVSKSSSKTTPEIKTNTNCHKSCVCQKPSKLISDPPGYILDLDQYKQNREKNDNDGCNCGQQKKKPFDSATKLQEISRQVSNMPKKNSKITSEIKTNTNCHKSCVCQKPSKLISDPPGYILDLDQYKKEHARNKDDKCKCSDQKKISSELSGYILDLQEYKLPKNKAHVISKNIFEVQMNTIETHKNADQKKNCSCSDSHNRSSRGYVLDLKQYKQTQQKNSCSCNDNESGKKRSNSAGYIVDLQQYKQKARENTHSETCNCKETIKKLEPITCCVGDIESNENRFKTNMQQPPTNSTAVSDLTCNCSEPSGNKLNNDFRKIQGPTRNALEVCKNIYGSHMNTYEIDYRKSETDDEMCNCNQSGANRREFPKSTKVALNDAKETCNCEQTSQRKYKT